MSQEEHSSFDAEDTKEQRMTNTGPQFNSSWQLRKLNHSLKLLEHWCQKAVYYATPNILVHVAENISADTKNCILKVRWNFHFRLSNLFALAT